MATKPRGPRFLRIRRHRSELAGEIGRASGGQQDALNSAGELVDLGGAQDDDLIPGIMAWYLLVYRMVASQPGWPRFSR